MATVATVVAEIESKSGFSYDPAAIAPALAAGLVAGDRISLGGKLVAEILEGGVVVMRHDDRETARVSLDSLTAQQRERMLVLKAIRAAQRPGQSMGAPKI